MRMSRKRRRQWHRRQQQEKNCRRVAETVAIGSISLLPVGMAEAGSIHTLSEVPAGFDTLRYERESVENYRAAVINVKDAAAGLVQARKDLDEARRNRQEAASSLLTAEKDLKDARHALQAAKQELRAAQQLSAQRTREAIAAQQAVADFQPQVWDQETVVQEAQAEADAVSASGHEPPAAAAAQRASSADSDLAAAIEQAWQSVDYQQNRLHDVEAMVAEAQAAAQGYASTQAAAEAQQAAYEQAQADYEARVEAAEEAVSQPQDYLDQLNDQLAALQDQCRDAEEAESEARAEARERRKEQDEAEKWVDEAAVNLGGTQQWDTEAAQNVVQAEKQEKEAITWDEQARYALEHFGEGYGFSTGFEFDSWQHSWRPEKGLEQRGRDHGHQVYQPYSYYASSKQWTLGLDTGWLRSQSGRRSGRVCGWTDTNLSAKYKTKHKNIEVNYGLTLGIPTGKDNVHQNAMLADDLAHFNSFGTGWNYTPEVEIVHHINDEEKVTAHVSYTWKGHYNFRLPGTKLTKASDSTYRIEKLDTPDKIDQAPVKEGKVHPGGEFRQDLAYQYSGPIFQYLLQLEHISYGSTVQTGAVLDASALATKYADHNVEEHYRSGDDWTIRMFGQQHDGPKDTWLTYGIFNYTMDTGYFQTDFASDLFAQLETDQYTDTESNSAVESYPQSGVHRLYSGFGLRHRCDKKQNVIFLLNYMRNSGICYTPLRNTTTNGYYRRSLLVRYQWQPKENQELSLTAERFNIQYKGPAGEKYHGWNLSAMYSWSF
ncbi:MAG: hypothetical protein SOZ01_02335 [Selenomonadaceae bacterium]|nr:hypothetical protein [Selenomonadaceae bacterium]MDY3915570.1 hypothetical protein [Selenomonadaceae bacterium]